MAALLKFETFICESFQFLQHLTGFWCKYVYHGAKGRMGWKESGPLLLFNPLLLSSPGTPRWRLVQHYTDKKENKIFLTQYIRKFRMEQLQSHIWLTASSYMGNICAFPHILGSPSSCMTSTHIWGNLTFYFISVLYSIYVYCDCDVSTPMN